MENHLKVKLLKTEGLNLFNQYKVASALQRGTSHIKNNTECQDALLTAKKEKFIFLGLADGAGSAKSAYSASWFILNALQQEFEEKLDEYLNSKELEKKILRFIETSLWILSKYSKLNFSDLSSTLLFALILKDEYIIGHIGDGLIVNVNQDKKLNILSKQDDFAFDFANQTIFCNSLNFPNRLKIFCGNVKDIENGLLLCSDGVEDTIYDYQNNKIIDSCFTMINWLDRFDEKKVSVGLKHNLRENIAKKSSDDLSIIVLKRKQERKRIKTMQQYKIRGKQINIHSDGVIFVDGRNTGIKQWRSNKKRYSSLSGSEIKELKDLDVQTALELKGFL
jgi:serine/threonine protein phosphatase PrpC